MSRKLIIDGNAVYEVDEECMLRHRLDGKESVSGGHGEKNAADSAVSRRSGSDGKSRQEG